MKVRENEIVFENQREKEIFLMILREVNIGELRPEIHTECVTMLEEIMRNELRFKDFVDSAWSELVYLNKHRVKNQGLVMDRSKNGERE